MTYQNIFVVKKSDSDIIQITNIPKVFKFERRKKLNENFFTEPKNRPSFLPHSIVIVSEITVSKGSLINFFSSSSFRFFLNMWLCLNKFESFLIFLTHTHRVDLTVGLIAYSKWNMFHAFKTYTRPKLT